jgi:heme A synthase
MAQRLFRRVAWGVLALVLGVIAWGAYVRATGAGAGCGQHWPTCRGEVIPRSPSAQTLIEYTHRLTSGLSFLAVVGLWRLSRRASGRGSPARRAAGFSMGFMISEALLGAVLVLFKLVADDASTARALAMSVHLVNTFLLLGSLALTAHFASGGAPLSLRGKGAAGALLTSGAAAFCLLGVSGAVTALGDTLFPAASLSEGLAQDASPGAHALLRLRALHPLLAAAVGSYLVAAAAVVSRRRGTPEVRARGLALCALIGLEVGAGTLNVALLAPVWMQLVHLGLADLVWIALVLLGAAALRRSPSEKSAGAVGASAMAPTWS